MSDSGRKCVIVTGGSGLVGMAMQDVVSEGGFGRAADFVFLSSKDANLLDRQAVSALFAKRRPTHVIHLAARVGGLFANMRANVEFLRENFGMNDTIFEECRLAGVSKLVSCMSTCIFPDKIQCPLNEDKIHLGPPHFSNEGYSYAKRMIDVQSRLYREQYGCNFVSVIPTNVYGPHDNWSIQDGHVIPGLIHKCFLAKESNTPFVVLGSGRPLRQFIYAKDLARLMLWAMESYSEPTPIILSVDPADEVSIGHVVKLIAEAMNFRGPLQFDTSKADGRAPPAPAAAPLPPSPRTPHVSIPSDTTRRLSVFSRRQFQKTASNDKLRKYLPDFKFTPLEQGIRETVAWFVANYHQGRCRGTAPAGAKL